LALVPPRTLKVPLQFEVPATVIQVRETHPATAVAVTNVMVAPLTETLAIFDVEPALMALRPSVVEWGCTQVLPRQE
jgi:hypothetical protein